MSLYDEMLNSLAPLPTMEAKPCATVNIPCAPTKACNKAPTTKGDKMHTYSNVSVDMTKTDPNAAAREYLANQFWQIRDKKVAELRKQFYIDQTLPKTLQELADMLKNGKYVIPKLEKDPTRHVDMYWPGYIEFRDPSKPADREGYEKAREAFADAQLKAERIVAVKDPSTDGLAAVEALEAWTYTP